MQEVCTGIQCAKQRIELNMWFTSLNWMEAIDWYFCRKPLFFKSSGWKSRVTCRDEPLVMLGIAMVAYTKPQQRKKEESEQLRGERSDQVYSSLVWKIASCRIQERNKTARRSINCMF